MSETKIKIIQIKALVDIHYSSLTNAAKSEEFNSKS